jgi:hypothetical protein
MVGWSKPYPETSGYMIPTLLRLADHYQADQYQADQYQTELRLQAERQAQAQMHAQAEMPDADQTGKFASECRDAALALGHWLLGIQRAEGAWNGGLHPSKNPRASVFNTGQILKGLAALYRTTHDKVWLDAAARGAQWLADGVGPEGEWPAGDYRSEVTPTYYTHVAWPMLEVWALTGEDTVKQAAQRVLQRMLTRIQPNGAIAGWGFQEDAPAFTHTIAYTIRGFQESARLLDDHATYAAPLATTLERIYSKAELSDGRLPGAFDLKWQPDKSFVCLTGNAQLAISLLLLEQTQPDLRIVNAAAKLVDFVTASQAQSPMLPGRCGGVAGSYPIWGKYMTWRYPNWAAKYLCDALLMLAPRLEREQLQGSEPLDDREQLQDREQLAQGEGIGRP